MSGKHLAIQASERQIRFITILNEHVLRSEEIQLSSNEQEAREQLDLFFKEQSYLLDHEGDVSLAWNCLRSTLLPSSVFSESSPEAIFRLCYGKDFEKDNVDYNRIAEMSLVHVYEIPMWIKRFFIIKFPRLVHQHEGTHALRKIMQSAFKLRATLLLHSDYFRLIVVKHNQLEFYGAFPCQNHEDVLYHLLFTLQQKEFTQQAGLIELVATTTDADSFADELEKSIARIGDLSEMKTTRTDHFVAHSQLLCV